MRKIYTTFFIATMFVLTLMAQTKNIKNSKYESIFNKPQNKEKSHAKDLKNTKDLIWKCDSIIGYDTLNVLCKKEFNTYDANGNLTQKITRNYYVSLQQDTKLSYTYDSNGNKITFLRELWVNNAWVNSSKVTCTYDGSGNRLTSLDEQWQNNAWINNNKSSFTYNAFNKTQSYVYEQWLNNAWLITIRRLYTYDSNGNELIFTEETPCPNLAITSKSTRTYNTNNKLSSIVRETLQNDILSNDERGTYTYDVNGYCTTLLWEKWENNNWVNSYRESSIIFDANGNNLSYIEENWQNNAWVNRYKHTNTYDNNNNELIQLGEMWNNSVWLNDYRYSKVYNTNGDMLESLSEEYDNNIWVNKNKDTYSYDINGNSLSGKAEYWSINNWIPYNKEELPVFSSGEEYPNFFGYAFRYEANFTSFTGINDIENNLNMVQIYPNPATTQITIEIPPTTKETNVLIYNLDGKQLLSKQIFASKTQIDINSLAAGFYIVKVFSGNSFEVKKIIKE